MIKEETKTELTEDIIKLMEELDISLTPEVLEVVEVSPELPSGGGSHCLGVIKY